MGFRPFCFPVLQVCIYLCVCVPRACACVRVYVCVRAFVSVHVRVEVCAHLFCLSESVHGC